MKKYGWFLMVLAFVGHCQIVQAADEAAPAAATQTAADVAAAPAEGPAAAADVLPAVAENLEFISGEVSAVDEPGKKVTVKLYGETENETNDKLLTVEIDDATDITDGEKDRDLKSLAAGTEVDVEYDPSTTKATYIFVY